MVNQACPHILFLCLGDIEMELFFGVASLRIRRQELDREARTRRTTDESRSFGIRFIKEFEVIFALVNGAFRPCPL